MEPQKSPQHICDELSAELREMAEWLTAGRLSAEQFRVALMTLEAEKVKRFGFTLSGENTPSGRTHFELRFADNGRLCASLDFDSGTRQLEVQHLCG